MIKTLLKLRPHPFHAISVLWLFLHERCCAKTVFPAISFHTHTMTAHAACFGCLCLNNVNVKVQIKRVSTSAVETIFVTWFASGFHNYDFRTRQKTSFFPPHLQQQFLNSVYDREECQAALPLDKSSSVCHMTFLLPECLGAHGYQLAITLVPHVTT